MPPLREVVGDQLVADAPLRRHVERRLRGAVVGAVASRCRHRTPCSARSPCSSCRSGSARATRTARGTSSSVKTPNAFRSLLFGGIEPVTIVGLGLSSAVPWPNAVVAAAGRLVVLRQHAGAERGARPAGQPVDAPGRVDDQVRVGVDLERAAVRRAPSVPVLLQAVVCATADPEIANATAATAASKRGKDRKSRRRRRGPVGPKIRVLIDALPLNCRTKAGRPPRATQVKSLVLPHHLL